MEELLNKCKLLLRICSDDFDEEINDLIKAGFRDLEIAGVIVQSDSGYITGDDLINRAIGTYVKMHFGEVDEYDRYKSSYDEQKAQLQNSTGYTAWIEAE